MRFAAIIPLLLSFAPSLCSAVDAPGKSREAMLALANTQWNERLVAAGGHPIVSSAYPTEEALVFLTAYSFTHETRYAEQAAIQLNYCHDRADVGLFFTLDGLTTRDYQARQIYNFYLGYRILGDGKYLRWADEAARAMLARIPRSAYACCNEVHTLFAADFFDRTGALRRTNGERIDANQNAEVALAFSLLAHDPASSFFDDPAARSIAYEELLASMSIQDLTTGAIALTEHVAGADTAYGSYAAFSWTWCQMMWHEPRFEPHIRTAGRWLSSHTDLAKDSDRYYPAVQKANIPYWEANFRLPLFWYCGIDAGAYASALRERMGHPEQTPGDRPAPLYWAYFDLMGMPRAFYLDATTPAK